MKIIRESSESEILKTCANILDNPCSISWESYGDLEVVRPETDVKAVVVDMEQSEGHARFYDVVDNPRGMASRKRGKHDFVIAVWEQGLRIVCYGKCRIGLVTLQPTTESASG